MRQTLSRSNDSEAIRRAIWDAKPYRPDGIIDGKTLLELVTTPTQPSDHDYPFFGLQFELHGIRYGELVTITAGSWNWEIKLSAVSLRLLYFPKGRTGRVFGA
jgi:hypothetical protein